VFCISCGAKNPGTFHARFPMLVHQPFLKCKNTHDCQTRIRLPYFIPEETFEHPAPWPRADRKEPSCVQHACTCAITLLKTSIGS